MSSLVLRLRSGQPLLGFPRRVHAMGTRVTAGLAAAVAVLAWATGAPWLVAVLALDFAARAVAGPRLSPLGRLAAAIVSSTGARRTTTSGAPKQLAAVAGASLLAAGAGSLASGHVAAGWTLVGVLAVFASLEAALGLCVVCRVYAMFVDCPDCIGER